MGKKFGHISPSINRDRSIMARPRLGLVLGLLGLLGLLVG